MKLGCLRSGCEAARPWSALAFSAACSALLADCLPDAPHVLVGVGDEGARHELLHRERGRVLEDHAALGELLVAQPAQEGGGLGGSRAMHRHDVRLAACSKILCV